MFYSASTGGFYSREIHGDNMPADVVEITAEEHSSLIEGQSQGKVIDFDEEGHPFLADPVVLPPTVQDFKDAIQLHMDNKAKEYGYDSLGSAVTYAEEPAVPKFQKEGKAFRAWRSQVWDFGYAQMAQVQGGSAPIPTVAELLESLPALVIPE